MLDAVFKMYAVCVVIKLLFLGGNTPKSIEDLFLNPAVKKAIILLLYLSHRKVLKGALAC
jgi:hypothetical protein